MNFLLDTHILIWFFNGDVQIGKKALSIIEKLENKKFVSIASIWEIAIKIGLNKLHFDGGTKEIVNLIEKNGFEILPISPKHTIEYETLDFLHRDPFDRILVAQARVDKLILLTQDRNIKLYKVKVQS